MLGFAISIFFNGSLRIKVVCVTEEYLVFYRSTQPTCTLLFLLSNSRIGFTINKYFGNSLFFPYPVGAVCNRTGHCYEITKLIFYSKARKYVDISGGTNLTPPLARFVTSLIRDVQVIVDFTIIFIKIVLQRWQLRLQEA